MYRCREREKRKGEKTREEKWRNGEKERRVREGVRGEESKRREERPQIVDAWRGTHPSRFAYSDKRRKVLVLRCQFLNTVN